MSSTISPQLATARPAQLPPALTGKTSAKTGEVAEARELQEAFSQFVGETFYGTLLQTMRKTVSEPAYFHGGQAEEMFQGRLDQQISADMASSGGQGLAQSLFASQFPQEAALLRQHDAGFLDQLNELTPRK